MAETSDVVLSDAARQRMVMGVARELEIRRLRRLLTGVVVAADRMRDDWAEGDDAVKKQLWTALHTAAEEAHDEVYPLPSEDEDPPDGECQHLWHETRTVKQAPTCPACGERKARR